VKAISDPLSTSHLVVNIIYSICTVSSLIFYIMFHYTNKNRYYFPSFAIVAVRNVIRMNDFEDTISFNNQTYWFFFYQSQNVMTTIFALIFITQFGHIKNQKYFLLAFQVIWCISSLNSFLKFNSNYCKECEESVINYYFFFSIGYSCIALIMYTMMNK
jgi:hypothetical protein